MPRGSVEGRHTLSSSQTTGFAPSALPRRTLLISSRGGQHAESFRNREPVRSPTQADPARNSLVWMLPLPHSEDSIFGTEHARSQPAVVGRCPLRVGGRSAKPRKLGGRRRGAKLLGSPGAVCLWLQDGRLRRHSGRGGRGRRKRLREAPQFCPTVSSAIGHFEIEVRAKRL
jgi:hypothetical protein